MSDMRKKQVLLSRQDLKDFGIELSNTTLLRLEAANRFPKRLYLTDRTVAWLKHELDAWIERCASAR